MTSLPLNPSLSIQAKQEYASAYQKCLEIEHMLSEQCKVEENNKNRAAGAQAKKRLIYIRILGHLLHFAPSPRGLDTLSSEILSCDTDDQVWEVGQMYYNNFLRGFRSNKGRTPTPSNRSSRPSFDSMTDMINDCLMEAPGSHAAAKKKALARDGFRCIISGSYDATSLRASEQLRNKRLAENPVPELVPTQCAHIFPASMHKDIPLGSDKRLGVSALYTVLERFGYTTLSEELEGAKIHRLENVMTLDPAIHSFFDMLELWFVATGESNQYTIRSIYGTELKYEGKEVTLESKVDGLPLPSPAYLAIHAACAQVAHLSGAAEHIDKYDRDMEDVMVLSPTGESAGLLDHALRGLQIAGY